MLRKLLTALALSLGTTAGAFPTAQSLREMAYAGDVAGIEAALAEAHAETVSGTAQPDDMRLLISGLNTSDPRLLAFAETWLAERPDSPYAHVVRAWQLYSRSFELRGTKTLRWVWPPALDLFRQAQRDGIEHAITAYQLAPDLVSASDAILRMQKTTKLIPTQMFVRLFEEIMARHHDAGTLLRAAALTNPAWGGGGLPALEALCAQYAPLVTDRDDFTAEVCVIDTIYANDMLREWPSVGQTLMQTKSPLLLYLRARFAAGRGAPEDADWVRSYIIESQMTDMDLAHDFDISYAQSGVADMVAHIVLQRAKAEAREVLAYDPYNRPMLRVMLSDSLDRIGNQVYPTDGNAPPLSAQERLGYTFDIVAGAPYDDTSWIWLSRYADDDGERPYFFPAWTNAIAYTNHDPATISQFVTDMVFRLQHYQSQTEAGEVGASDLTPVLCELMRADRIRDAVCDAVGRGTWGCVDTAGGGGYMLPTQTADLLTIAATTSQCTAQMSSPINDLIYEPVSIPRP